VRLPSEMAKWVSSMEAITKFNYTSHKVYAMCIEKDNILFMFVILRIMQLEKSTSRNAKF